MIVNVDDLNMYEFIHTRSSLARLNPDFLRIINGKNRVLFLLQLSNKALDNFVHNRYVMPTK